MAPRGAQRLPESLREPLVATPPPSKYGDMSPSQPLVLRRGQGAQIGPLGPKMAVWGPFGHPWGPGGREGPGEPHIPHSEGAHSELPEPNMSI